LRDLGTRGDIIKTMHRAFTERGQDRGIADYVIDSGTTSSPIIGRLVGTGLHDELTGEAYAVIDGVDGRAHHVRFRGIEAFAHAPPAGAIMKWPIAIINAPMMTVRRCPSTRSAINPPNNQGDPPALPGWQ
jgi:hypothetical protein